MAVAVDWDSPARISAAMTSGGGGSWMGGGLMAPQS